MAKHEQQSNILKKSSASANGKKPDACSKQQGATGNSSSLQQPIDSFAQLSPLETADLQRTYGNGFVQRAANSDGDNGSNIASEIEQTRGSGSPLPDNVRGKMEGHFGADFSQVNIHNNQKADTLSRSLNADAFTTGSDIYFRQGAYSPNSKSGEKLIAHELTHVVQQGGTTRKGPQAKLTVGAPNDKYEQEADAVAEAAVKAPDVGTQPAPMPNQPAPDTQPAAGGGGLPSPEQIPDSQELGSLANDPDRPTPEANGAAGDMDKPQTTGEQPGLVAETSRRIQEGANPQDEVAKIENQKAAEAKSAEAQGPNGSPEQQAQSEQGKQEKGGEKKDKEAVKEGKTAVSKPPKAQLPDSTDVESLKFDSENISEPEVSDPLPNWNQLAYGTIQFSSSTAQDELDWRNSVLGTNLDPESDQKNDFQSAIESQFNDQMGMGDTEEGDVDRGAMLRDALVGGIMGGVVQGTTDFAADLLIGAATSKIPKADGWLAVANIAADPEGWALNSKKAFTGVFDEGGAFDDLGGKWGKEDTAAGKAAFIFEFIVNMLDWLSGMMNVFIQVLSILIAVLAVLAATANAIPGGQSVGSFLLSVIKVLESILKVLQNIVNILGLLKPVLQAIIIVCRSVDLQQTKADPELIRQKQAALRNTMQSFVAGVTTRGLNEAKGAVRTKLDKNALRKEIEAAEVAPADPKVKSKQDLINEYESKYGSSYKTQKQFEDEIRANDPNLDKKAVSQQAAAAKKQANTEALENDVRRKQEMVDDLRQRGEDDAEYKDAKASLEAAQKRRDAAADPNQKHKTRGAMASKILLGIDTQSFTQLKDSFTNVKSTWNEVSGQKKQTYEARVQVSQQEQDDRNRQKQEAETEKQKLTDLEAQQDSLRSKGTTLDQTERQRQSDFDEKGVLEGEKRAFEAKERQADVEHQKVEAAKQEIKAAKTDRQMADDKRWQDMQESDALRRQAESKKAAIQKQISALPSEGDGVAAKRKSLEAELKKANEAVDAAEAKKVEGEERYQQSKKKAAERAKAAREARNAASNNEERLRQELSEERAAQTERKRKISELGQAIREQDDAIADLQQQKQDIENDIEQLKTDTNFQDTDTLDARKTAVDDRIAEFERTAKLAEKRKQQAQDVVDALEREKKRGHVYKYLTNFEGHITNKKGKQGWGDARNWMSGSGGSGLTNYITQGWVTNVGAGQALGNLILPVPTTAKTWVEKYGKGNLAAIKVDYEGGLPTTTNDDVQSVKVKSGSGEAGQINRVFDQSTVNNWIESQDFSADAPDSIDLESDTPISSARKKELYNEQARDYLKNTYFSHVESNEAKLMEHKINKTYPARDFDYVAHKGTGVSFDLEMQDLELKLQDGNTYTFTPTIYTHSPDGVEQEFSYRYDGDAAYQTALEQGKVAAGDEMLKLTLKSKLKGSNVSGLENKSDYDVTVTPEGETNSPISVTEPNVTKYVPAIRTKGRFLFNEYQFPKIEANAVDVVYKNSQNQEIAGKLKPSGKDTHVVAKQTTETGDRYKMTKGRVFEIPPATKEIEYEPFLDSGAPVDEEMVIQRWGNGQVDGKTTVSPNKPLTSTRSFHAPTPQDESLVIQREVADEALEEDEAPIPMPAGQSLDEIAQSRQRQMLSNLPEPPQESIHQINASSTASDAIRGEEYALKIQSQETAALEADAKSQMMETEAVQGTVAANQKAIGQHQADIDQHAADQEEMAKTAAQGQQPASQGFDLSNEVGKLLQGIIMPLVSGLTMASDKTGSGAGSGDAAQSEKAAKDQSTATAGGVKVLQQEEGLAKQWRSETAGIKAGATSEEKRLDQFGNSIDTAHDNAAEGVNELTEARETTDSQLEELIAEKETQEFMHEEAVNEVDMWADEHQSMREEMFSQLEADLEREEDKRIEA